VNAASRRAQLAAFRPVRALYALGSLPALEVLAVSQTLLPRARAGLALAGLAVLAGCGSSSGGDSGADPASVVPGSAPLYASVLVKPEGDQKTQVDAVLRKVLRTDDPGTKIEKLFDDATRKDGVTYEKDVKPWLGKRVGVFLSSLRNSGHDADFGVVLPAADTGAALDSIRKGDTGVRKRTYRDVDYQVNSKGNASAAVGGFAVGGTEAGVKAVIDTSKDSAKAITKNEDFAKATSEVGKDGLVTAYVDPGALLDAAAAGGSIDGTAVFAVRQLLSSAGARAVGASLEAQADGFVVDFATLGAKSSGVSGGDGPAALAAVPGDSWLGLGVGNLGGQIDNAIKQLGQLGAFAGLDVDQILEQVRRQSGLDVRKDLIDWMGDAALFVRGSSLGDVGGGLIVESKDRAATARGVKRLGQLLRRQGRTVTAVSGIAGVDTGVSFKLGSGIEVFLTQAGDRFVGAVGRSSLVAALKSSQTLGDSPGFQQAASRLGEGLRPSLFFAMAPVLELVQSSGLGSDTGFKKALPYLQAFTTAVAAGKRSGDVGKGRLVIGVR
jgi:hypothetical protein